MSSKPSSGQKGRAKMKAIPFKYRQMIYRWGIRLIAVSLFLVYGFPIYWMAQNAFKTRQAILSKPTFIPDSETFSLEPFTLLISPDVFRYFVNSIIVTSLTILLVVSISLISGYGLARYKFSGKASFARFLLLGYMFSPIVISLPLYLIWDSLGLLNSYLGLTLVLSTTLLPVSVWIMWKYINTIPISMEESGFILGAPRWRVFLEIVIPQTKPAIMAVSLFSFAIAWSDFTFAKILNPQNEMSTLPPGLLQLVGQGFDVAYNEVMAVSLIVSLPSLIFAYFLQSYLLEGFRIRSL